METTNVIEKVKNVLVVTSEQLRYKLTNVNVGQIGYLTMETKPKMNKKDRVTKEENPYLDQVTKVTKMSFIFGNDYETRKNNNLEKQGLERTFEVQENNVGEHISKVVLYNEKYDRYYLQVEVNQNKNCKIISSYYFKGQEIDKKMLNNYLPESKTDNDVIFISVTIDNIKKITFGGTEYVVMN